MQKQWIVTGTSMVVEADTPEEAVDRAQETSGWHWEAVEADQARATWPETDIEKTQAADWRHEVANRDTILGFRDWLKSKAGE